MAGTFEVGRKDFADALTRIREAVKKRNTIPILANIVIEPAGDAAIRLKATDLEILIETECPAKAVAFDAITLPCAMLTSIVGKLAPDARIAVELGEDGQAVTLRAGRARFKLQALPVEDWPDMRRAVEAMHRFALPAADLLKTLQTCAFAASTEETRFYLNGVYIHHADDLVFVATDGHRLARTALTAPDFTSVGADAMPGIIVSNKSVRILCQLLKDAEKESDVSVGIDANRIELEISDTVLTAKLIDGTFPDYERVIPQANNKEVRVSAAALTAALNRVSTVVGNEGKGVRFTFTPETLTLDARDPDAGEANEAVDLERGIDLETGFNADYAREVLGHIDGDTVSLHLAEPDSPAILRGADPETLFVLMPLRIR